MRLRILARLQHAAEGRDSELRKALLQGAEVVLLQRNSNLRRCCCRVPLRRCAGVLLQGASWRSPVCWRWQRLWEAGALRCEIYFGRSAGWLGTGVSVAEWESLGR